MKKFFFVILIFMINLYAFAFELNWDIGTVAFGGQVADAIEPTFNVRVLDFSFEFDNGFYTCISPFDYSCIINKPIEDNNHSGYFVNLGFGYDFFKFKNQVQLMPYFDTSWLALEGLKNFRLESGLCVKIFSKNPFSENAEVYHMKGEILNVKTGIRLQNLNPAFYFSLGTGLLNLLMFIWGTKE